MLNLFKSRAVEKLNLNDKKNLKIFHALDSENRMKILAFLLQNGESSASEIKEALGLSDGTFSYHTNILIEADLLDNDWRRAPNRRASYSFFNVTDRTRQMIEE